VSALCACVLGDRDNRTAQDWPPRSVAELVRHLPNTYGFDVILTRA